MLWAVRRLDYAVLIFAIGARFTLAALNTQSNDDHVPVIQAFMTHGRLPPVDACFECYHPKFYYFCVVLAAYALHISVADSHSLYFLAQALSAVAGVLTLQIGWSFIRRLNISPLSQTVTFALFALNPALVTISVQATNDSFAALFSALAIEGVDRLRRAVTFSRTTAAGVIAWPIVASLTKASGIVIWIGSLCALVALWGSAVQKKASAVRVLALAGASITLYLAIVPVVGQFVESYASRGSPFALNVPKSAPPPLWGRAVPSPAPMFQRPGVLSVADGFFTFDLAGILAQPHLTYNTLDLTAGRTSLWTQLFARSQFIFYEHFPDKWIDDSPKTQWLGRVSFLLALPIVATLMLGLICACGDIVRLGLKRRFSSIRYAEAATIAPFFLFFLAAYASFNYVYRDIAGSKAIYVAPAALAIAWCFTRGLRFLAVTSKQWHLAAVVCSIGLALSACYLVSYVFLLARFLMQA